MSWLKKEEPKSSPAIPRKVSLELAHKLIDEQSRKGPLPPQFSYLQGQLPKLETDRWGQPVPLSTEIQERLDRIVAVFIDPVGRTIDLLHSGTLDTIEANTVRYGHPDVYDQLAQTLIGEMADAAPPFPVWVEATLGIFFGRDAALVYNDGTKDAEKPDTGGSNYPGKAPPPTPADLSGEEQLRRMTP